jgi:D-apionolactonase
MTSAPSRAIRLFGTEEPVARPVLLRAGPLSAELEEGNLRYILFGGREVLRAVSFIVRDKNWGTYRPQIGNLEVRQDEGAFSVSYDAVVRDERQEFRYRAAIRGEAGGQLTFEIEGEAVTDVLTSRTGFVVLHPIEGLAGRPATIEHVDGRIIETRFPDLIDPVQPMMDLRALTHEFAPGFKVTCRMEGDTFEMEDQRNWTDASYKTYVRPLALPWPYTLRAGEQLRQRVVLTVASSPGASLAPAASEVALSLAPTSASMPPLGFGLDPKDAAATLDAAELLKQARPHHVVCAFDAGRGHDRSALKQAVAVGRALGAELWLEAVLRSVEGYEEEVRALGRMAAELGSPFSTVLVSPAPDLKCTLPGSVWPPCPPAEGLYRVAREAFPNVRIGGGMFSYFTELNRKRPPVEHLDLVSFTTSPLVHAGDDRSATESLESLPAVTKSVRAFIEGKPFHVGPSAIGMRDNPYGEAPMENPGNIRQAMNRIDPRQRGLFAAAWALGYVAHMASGGAAAATLGGGVGEFGLVHARMPYAQPWFDEAGQGLYPVFHVFRGLAALAGQPTIDVASSIPRAVQAIGTENAGQREVWIANLTNEERPIALWGHVSGHSATLDEETFSQAARDPAFIDSAMRTFSADRIALRPYAVVRLTF